MKIVLEIGKSNLYKIPETEHFRHYSASRLGIYTIKVYAPTGVRMFNRTLKTGAGENEFPVGLMPF
ncbi:MAG: hypothetical protein WCR04_03595 [Fibrobacteraceae bacterium]